MKQKDGETQTVKVTKAVVIYTKLHQCGYGRNVHRASDFFIVQRETKTNVN